MISNKIGSYSFFYLKVMLFSCNSCLESPVTFSTSHKINKLKQNHWNGSPYVEATPSTSQDKADS
jgi:hypothetical protein